MNVKFISQKIPDGYIGKLIDRIYERKDETGSIMSGQNVFEEVTQKGNQGGGNAPYGYRRAKVVDPPGGLRWIRKESRSGMSLTGWNQTRWLLAVEFSWSTIRGASYKRITHQLNLVKIVSSDGKT